MKYSKQEVAAKANAVLRSIIVDQEGASDGDAFLDTELIRFFITQLAMITGLSAQSIVNQLFVLAADYQSEDRYDSQ